MKETRSPFGQWKNFSVALSFGFDQPVPEHSRHHRSRRQREFSAWLVRRGEVTLECDQSHAEARPGQWLICAGQSVFQQMTEGTHLLSLRMDWEWPHGKTFLKGEPVQLLEAATFPDLERTALALLALIPPLDLTRNVGQQMNRDLRLTLCECLLYRQRLAEWSIAFAKAMIASGREWNEAGRADSRVSEAISLLEHHPLSAPFPRQALERLCGVQLPRLNQLSHETFGMTLHAFWEERRYRYALRMLRLHYQTVKEIASSLGFAELPHFSRWFRNHSGVAPRTFRQRHQQGVVE